MRQRAGEVNTTLEFTGDARARKMRQKPVAKVPGDKAQETIIR